ncbi:hypothetical protein B0H14DRAFT_2355106, partial [Mycena olivaceomarginata]
PPPPPALTRGVRIPNPVLVPTECDALVERTLATTQTDEEATLSLYGTVSDTDRRVHVTIAAACANHALPHAAAAFGLYWGDNGIHNRGYGVPGIQSASRALLHGILFAITVANPARHLEISTTSKYAIRAICHLAGGNHTRGWACANGNLLEQITRMILGRSAQILFTALNDRGDSSPLKGARALAHGCCRDTKESSHIAI